MAFHKTNFNFKSNYFMRLSIAVQHQLWRLQLQRLHLQAPFLYYPPITPSPVFSCIRPPRTCHPERLYSSPLLPWQKTSHVLRPRIFFAHMKDYSHLWCCFIGYRTRIAIITGLWQNFEAWPEVSLHRKSPSSQLATLIVFHGLVM